MNVLPKPLLLKVVSVLLLTAVVQVIGLPQVQPAFSGSVGCVRSAGPAAPGGDESHPTCESTPSGPYCYQCAYDPGDNGSNWTICAEFQTQGATSPICGDFSSLPDWFGTDPENQDPGFGSLG